jgi:hypothetical protein
MSQPFGDLPGDRNHPVRIERNIFWQVQVTIDRFESLQFDLAVLTNNKTKPHKVYKETKKVKKELIYSLILHLYNNGGLDY